MTKEIKLTQNKFALVDDEDYDFLMQWKWYANRLGNTFYAMRKESRIFGKQKTIFMHRIILNTQLILNTQQDQFVDHINRNGLDNRKENLRICTTSENAMNRKIPKNNTSGYKGVCFDKKSKKWKAYIKENGKRIHLGYFDSPEESALAYNEKALELFGEFARLNEI